MRTHRLCVFVTAHPDDESMFFIPTIRSLKCTKWLVCLSNGDYEGLGKQREVELHHACGLLGFDEVILVHRSELPDSPSARWDPQVIARVLGSDIPTKTNIDIHIMTFDPIGISGHINHRDTHQGVKRFLQQHEQMQSSSKADTPRITGWQLQSITNPIRKYIPLYHWIVLILGFWIMGWRNNEKGENEGFPSEEYCWYQPALNWKCMAAHRTQFVWYRRLFVIFSAYTYHNEWKKIE